MRYAVLGALRLEDDGPHSRQHRAGRERLAVCEQVRLPGLKERQLLALLLAGRGRTLSSDELVDSLWEGHPPLSAARSLASHVSRVRATLEPIRTAESRVLVSVSGGWRLELEDDRVDSARFTRRARLTADALRQQRYVEAFRHAEAALGEWRGEAFEGYLSLPLCGEEAARLERIRQDVVDDATEARLALGHSRELISDIEASLAEDPFRERRWGHLMLALYRAGRQAEALETYLRARRLLADEVGVEPGTDLRRLHKEVLAQSITLHAPLSHRSGSRGADRCPFMGLSSYTEDDADVLVGRERYVARALTTLAEQEMVCVTGPSGAGKSSVLHAGLVPSVRAGALPGSDSWTVRTMTPTGSPLDRLERTGEAGVDLLVVDQFEELLTQCHDVEERVRFVEALLARVDRGTRLVLAVRADYWADLAFHRKLADRVAATSLMLGPLTDDELRLVVTEGAQRCGLDAEDALAEAIVADAGGEPGVLPLVSTALEQTWQQRHGRRLLLEGYRRAGGLQSALAQLAEATYLSLDEEGRDAAKAVLLRLVADGRGGRTVRRRATAAQLVGHDAARERALHALVEARLVISGEDGVEVAHEALFSRWPRLATWLGEDVAARRVRDTVAPAADSWVAGGRNQADLYRGPRLVEAVQLLESGPGNLTADEREFVTASSDAAEQERMRAVAQAAHERRRNRRLRQLLAGAAVLLVATITAGVLTLQAQTRASSARVDAVAARLGSEALVQRRADLSLLLAAQGAAMSSTPATRLNLLAALLRMPRLLAVNNIGSRLMGLALAPDGRRAATSDNLGHVWLVNPVSLTVRRQLSQGSGLPVTGLVFSPDGRRLLSSDQDPRDGANIVIRQVSTGASRPLAHLPDGYQVASSRDGSVITVASVLANAVLIRSGSGYRVVHLPMRASPSNVTANGRRFAVLDGSHHRLTLRDARTGAVVRAFSGIPGGLTTALSPDGRLLATADDQGTVHLVDTRTGQTVGDLAGHSSFVEDIEFARSGAVIATGSDDGTAMVWDVSRQVPVQRFDVGGQVLQVAFARNARTLTTATTQGTLARWDVTGRRGFGSLRPLPYPHRYLTSHQPPGPLLVVLPRDGSLVTVGTSGLRVLDPHSLQVTRRLLRHATAGALAVDGAGDRLAVASRDRTVRVLDLRTWQVAATIHGVSPLATVAMSPDGRRLAVADETTNAVAMFDLASQRRLWSTAVPGRPSQVVWQGDRLAVSAEPARVAILSASDGSLTHMLQVGGGDYNDPSIAFLPDASLEVGNRNGDLQHWNPQTGIRLGAPDPVEPESGINQLAVTRDGRVVGGGGVGAFVTDPQHPDAVPVELPGLSPEWVALDRDRDRLFGLDPIGTIAKWDLDSSHWLTHACQTVHGTLTRVEWSRFVGPLPYEPAC